MHSLKRTGILGVNRKLLLGRKKKSKLKIVLPAALAAACIVPLILIQCGILRGRVYTAEDFNITTICSAVDFNENGIDDYTDILLGARKDAENHPEYDDRYWDTGFPPDDIGVCTDVIWRAFRNAGYDLRKMVDIDIEQRPEAYPNISVRDSNIDFRRVTNLRVFFDEHAESLTPDTDKIDQWQPGDIVVFKNDVHIGIVSDKRNKDGLPYIIHNGGQRNREEDILGNAEITGHYRFDASSTDSGPLIPWQE